MFNKNVFTQKDPIADLIKPMLEAQTKAKMEELKGNQAVLDKNKNNKLDAQDFKILRGEKKAVKEDAEQVEEGLKDIAKKAVKALTGGSDEDQLKNLQKKMGVPQTGKKPVKEEEELEESSPFDWKKPREPEVKGGAGVKKGRAYGGAAQKSKPEQDDADDKKKVKEEVELLEAEALIENYEMINEVSVGAKIRAYAQHSRDAFDHNDMGNEDEADRHSERASKIMKHIEKHHGPEAAKHAQKAARAAIFGRDDPHGHGDGGHDVLHGGLRSNKTVTKAGKVPKGTQSAMKNKIMGYGRHRDTAGPKGHLPEEVEQIDELSLNTMKSAKEKLGHKAYDAHMDDNKYAARHYAGRALNMADKIKKKERKLAKEEVEQVEERTLTKDETAEKERIVKGMKKGLAGFKARYGDRAKSVMYATATKAAKKD